MRQASKVYKRQEILDLELPTKPSMQAIMEVEDMMAVDQSQEERKSNYFTAENEESKVPIAVPLLSQEDSKESLKNSPPSNENNNFLENAAGNSSQDGHRFSHAIGANMHKSYTLRKESGANTLDGGKPGSSNKGHLDNIAEENLEAAEKKDEAIEEDKKSSSEGNPYDQTE
jgi:hypothetical protein